MWTAVAKVLAITSGMNERDLNSNSSSSMARITPAMGRQLFSKFLSWYYVTNRLTTPTGGVYSIGEMAASKGIALRIAFFVQLLVPMLLAVDSALAWHRGKISSSIVLTGLLSVVDHLKT